MDFQAQIEFWLHLYMSERESFIKYTIFTHGNCIHRFLLRHHKIYAWRIFKFMRPEMIIKIHEPDYCVLNFRGKQYDIDDYRRRKLLLE